MYISKEMKGNIVAKSLLLRFRGVVSHLFQNLNTLKEVPSKWSVSFQWNGKIITKIIQKRTNWIYQSHTRIC